MSPLLDPSVKFSRRLKVGLIVAGAASGAVLGIALTALGKIVAGAPPATLGNYVWNAVAFAAITGVISPMVTWSTLRRVPLWRTIAEPLAFALSGAVVGVVASSPLLFLILPPALMAVSALRMRRAYADPAMLPRATATHSLKSKRDDNL